MLVFLVLKFEVDGLRFVGWGFMDEGLGTRVGVSGLGFGACFWFVGGV